MTRTFSSEKEFRDWNESMFIKYDNEHCVNHPNPLLRFVEHRRIRTLLRFCAIKDGDKVLEVGCGSGYVLNLINRGELYGIDISKTAIEWAKRKLSAKPNVKHLSAQPAERMKFANDTFDVVFCSEVIEHVPNPRKLAEEICRVVKPGGRVVFTFPNEGTINFAKQTVKWLGLYRLMLKGIPEHMEDEWHLSEFSLPLFKRTVAGVFHIRRVRAIPFFFLPLRYAALLRPNK
ncbi:class I SAM-dependent methyltransferase [Candidatus Woesearchaeota archaeon]|nr:class I SAM-dependent methyltransferase [Candidatus Woesearchaeota archaeon]